ncbi:MAG: N-formylglutamate amidohydrolase [Clostridia bacterium]|nr:N-formylglutamate amidohydrolase [Clostridia bacterium]
MKNTLLIHIPHSSLYIPEEYRRTALISQDELDEENLFMCDTGVRELVPEALIGNELIFPYSRLYCDVERFRDGWEPMDAYGMGYIYTRDSRGREIFRPDKAHCVEVDRVYEAHHRQLDERVSDILNEFGSCLIIDLHSFSDEAVRRIFGNTGCPDVCIGLEEDRLLPESAGFPGFDSSALVHGIKSVCRGLGLSTMINYPYRGSIMPNRFYGSKDARIVSIMLEINKRVLK